MENEFAKTVFLYKANKLSKAEKESLEKDMAENEQIKRAVEGLMLIDEEEYFMGYDSFLQKMKATSTNKPNKKIIKIALPSIAAAIIIIILITKPPLEINKENYVAELNQNNIEEPISQLESNVQDSNISIKTQASKAKQQQKPVIKKDAKNEQAFEQIEYASSGLITKDKSKTQTTIIANKSRSVPTRPIDFDEFKQKNTEYPESEKGSTISGKVVLKIIILQDGSIGDSIQVITGISKVFNDEAIRVIKKSPKWLPALKEGKAVDMNVLVPIEFIDE